ncbi:NAD(P)H-binding protein [Bacillus shivajii]|uniref:NAD(P)H-binding protein n=1 Tax=Bacillus shivajii TaxID=1983719 RepID=UPI001CFB4134|nr:NAD(P)H-binding protein [Bacillus shivajii]UCZ53091.1 NAD(P)H-binding protein [Bacillus shivajii]
MKKALIAGATGLIGKHVVQQLIEREEYDEIRLITRKKTPFKHEKVTEYIIDFKELDQYAHLFAGINDVFVCLGTTMKKAKTKKQFMKVDFTYPLKIATLSEERGVNKMLTVTAIGSDRESRLFYNRVKGKLEEALVKVNIPSLHIFRPSLLTGEREEFRPGEKMASYVSAPISLFLAGPFEKYKPVKAHYVAAVMCAIAKEDSKGVHIYESDKIRQLGQVLFHD